MRLLRSSGSVSGGWRGRGGGCASLQAQLFRCRLALSLLTIRAVHAALTHPDDFHLVQECLEGKTSALTHLQAAYREPLLAFLQGSGASPPMAGEIVVELRSDCIASQTGTVPKLARYNGTCALSTFLNTIPLNALLTRRRRGQRWTAIMTDGEPTAGSVTDTGGRGYSNSDRNGRLERRTHSCPGSCRSDRSACGA